MQKLDWDLGSMTVTRPNRYTSRELENWHGSNNGDTGL